MTLQMSKSLIEGGGSGIHIYTHYNGICTYVPLHNSGPFNSIVQCPYVLYCSMFVVIYI